MDGLVPDEGQPLCTAVLDFRAVGELLNPRARVLPVGDFGRGITDWVRGKEKVRFSSFHQGGRTQGGNGRGWFSMFMPNAALLTVLLASGQLWPWLYQCSQSEPNPQHSPSTAASVPSPSAPSLSPPLFHEKRSCS